MLYLQKIKQDEEVKSLISASGEVLRAMNYTEHGLRHATYVSNTAGKVLSALGYDEGEVELAMIAGYLHDVGNMINRSNHGVISATIVYDLLKRIGLPIESVTKVVTAIGNHEEEIGYIVSTITAALVIADKSDAHRTRVLRNSFDPNDIHDRVNFSIKKSFVEVDKENAIISSRIYMDNSSSVMDYLKIYLKRISMSEKAAQFLNCTFKLYINDVLINSPKHIGTVKMNRIIKEIDNRTK